MGHDNGLEPNSCLPDDGVHADYMDLSPSAQAGASGGGIEQAAGQQEPQAADERLPQGHNPVQFSLSAQAEKGLAAAKGKIADNQQGASSLQGVFGGEAGDPGPQEGS